MALIHKALVWVTGLHRPAHVSNENQLSLRELLGWGRLIGCNLITLCPAAALTTPHWPPPLALSTWLLASLNLHFSLLAQCTQEMLTDWRSDLIIGDELFTMQITLLTYLRFLFLFLYQSIKLLQVFIYLFRFCIPLFEPWPRYPSF